jgi:2-polyprenyl-3-methyl-5-hydroxy-6-metoxy-1,4-benzoquinol methylase
MNENIISYYSNKTMVMHESKLSVFLNRFSKNYSREKTASEAGLRGDICLDIACGDGELLTKYLYKQYIKAEGVDISKSLIEKAKSKKRENCSFYIADIEDFVEKAIKAHKKYDTVYMLAILEHIPWPSLFLEKIFKIVKKGGHIVVETPNVAWFPHRVSLLLGNFPVTAPTVGVIPGVYDEHIRFFTFDTMNKITVKNGFKLIKIDSSGKFRFIKRLLPKLLSPNIVAVYEK